MKIVLRVVLVFLVVLVIAALIGPSLIDWNRYRGFVENQIERVTERDVKIAGDLDFTVLPAPALRAGEITVANSADGEAPDMLRLERLEAVIELLPLLGGQIRVRTVRLVAPVFVIERVAEGRTNWHRLAAATPADGSSRRGLMRAQSGPGFGWLHIGPDAVSINAVEIQRGTVIYRDLVDDWGETIEHIDASLSATTLEGPFGARGGFDWRGRRYGLTGTGGGPPRDNKRPLDIRLDERLAGLKVTLVGRIEETPIGTELSGAFNLRADRPDLLFRAEAPELGPGASTLLALEAVMAGNADGVSLNKIAMQWGDFAATGALAAKLGAERRFAAEFDGRLLNLDAVLPKPPADAKAPRFWPFGLVAPAQVAGVEVGPDASGASAEAKPERGLFAVWRGTIAARLAGIVFHDGLIEDVTVKADYAPGRLTLSEATARLPGTTELSLKGDVSRSQIGYGFDGSAALAGERARELFTWFGASTETVAAERLGRIAYRGDLTLAPGRLAFGGFEAGLDGGQARGDLALAFGTRPRVEGTLAITRANLDPYRSLLETMTADGDGDPLAGDRVLRVIDKTDGALKLDADVIVWRGVEIRGVSGELSRDAASLTVRSLKIENLDGATLVLSGEVDELAGAAMLAISGRATGADLRPALRLVGFPVAASGAALGPADLTLDAAVEAGSGTVTAKGVLGGTTVSLDSRLKAIEKPVLGMLGAGAMTSTLSLSSSDAAELAGQLALFRRRARPGQPTAAEVTLTHDKSHSLFAVDLTARVGAGQVTGAFKRTGAAEAAHYQAELSLDAADGAGFFKAMGVAPGGDGAALEALNVGLAAQGPAASISITPLTARLGAMALTGEGHLDLSGERPKLDLAVEGEALDVSRLAAFLWPELWPRSAEPGWSDEPLSLAMLGALDGTLNAEADAFRLGGFEFTEPRFQATLANGTFTVGDGRARVLGGPMTFNAALRGGTATPGLALSIKFIQADGAALSRAFWDKALLDGPLDGAVSLSGQGASEKAFIGSMKGTATIKSAGGSFVGFDLDGFENARAALHAGEDVGAALAHLETGRTPYELVEVGLVAEAGHIRTTAGRIVFPSGTGEITASADLDAWSTHLTLMLPIRGDPTRPLLIIDGPLDAPVRRLDSEALRGVLKREAEGRARPVPAVPIPEPDHRPLAEPFADDSPAPDLGRLQDVINQLPDAR